MQGRKVLLGLLATAAMVASTSASAATLLVSFAPTNDTRGPGSFNIDDNPIPLEFLVQSFVASITNGTGQYSGITQVRFYTDASNGGFGNYDGPQLFEGLPNAPQILTGTFNVVDFLNSDITGVVTISAVTGAVPEPATWAMMLVGFGMVGGATRYGRKRTKVAYA
jgi:hypothetical protein